MTGDLSPVAVAGVPVTPQLMMQETAQSVFLWITIAAAILVVAVAAFMSIKRRSSVPALMVAGGFAAILMEPVVTFLGHAVHPALGQITLFTSVDRAIPWHIALGYMAGFGVFYLLMFWRHSDGILSAAGIWKITLVAALCFYLGEAYPVERGLWAYFGYQPLWIWKGTSPPTWSMLNATCMLTSATLMLTAAPHLDGVKRVLLLPLAVAGAYMGHMGAGFPMYNAMNSAAPPWVVEGSGMASIGMALLLIWLCTLVLVQPAAVRSIAGAA